VLQQLPMLVMQSTFGVLHQNLLPCVSAPGLNWLVTKVCRAQIENMLKDLKHEIRRVNRGMCPVQDACCQWSEGSAATVSACRIPPSCAGLCAAGDPIPTEQQEKLAAGNRSWVQPDTESHQLDAAGS
jgi:hypothetical protein